MLQTYQHIWGPQCIPELKPPERNISINEPKQKHELVAVLHGASLSESQFSLPIKWGRIRHPFSQDFVWIKWDGFQVKEFLEWCLTLQLLNKFWLLLLSFTIPPWKHSNEVHQPTGTTYKNFRWNQFSVFKTLGFWIAFLPHPTPQFNIFSFWICL